MVRSMLVIALLLLGALTAGCGQPAAVQEVLVHSNKPVIVNSTVQNPTLARSDDAPPVPQVDPGHISGVVVDSAIRPLPGAIVRLPGLDLQDPARRDGSFSFTELLPGAYLVRANASGYFPAEAVVAVQSGQMTRIKFVLEPVPPPTPYHVTQTFNGFAQITDDGLLARGLYCNACTFVASFDRTPDALLVEALMDSTTEGGNSFYWAVRESGDSYGSLADGSGGNPLRTVVFGERLANTTYLEIDVFPQSFPAPEMEKSFQVFLTAWYNELPPDGWSVVDGDR